MALSIFRTKPINTEDTACDTGMKRCLFAFDLTLLGVGAVVYFTYSMHHSKLAR